MSAELVCSFTLFQEHVIQTYVNSYLPPISSNYDHDTRISLWKCCYGTIWITSSYRSCISVCKSVVH